MSIVTIFNNKHKNESRNIQLLTFAFIEAINNWVAVTNFKG